MIQFYKIQIVEGDKWEKHALRQHQLIVTEPCKRGVFYSNTFIKQGHPSTLQPFVIDVPKFHLYADPDSLPIEYRAEIARVLSHYLGLSSKGIEQIRIQMEKKSRSRKLALWLSKEQQEQIRAWWEPYARQRKIAQNALFFVQDYRRSYPFGSLLGAVLHTVRAEKEAKTQQAIPTGGLEWIFHSYLTGKNGKRQLIRSPRNPLDTGKILALPEHGADVYLTINHHLQAIAEEEIAHAVQKASAKRGWAIMMEPRTGEVWALAQYPPFDPGKYHTYFNTPKGLEDTQVKAVTEPYEPGSIMKPLTVAVCLKANKELEAAGKKPLFFPEEKVATAYGNFPGRSKPIKDVRLHKFLNMDLALQKSSNIYMARMIQRVVDVMGDAWYRSTLQDLFGFGKKTGIELPSESPGLLPTPGKLHPNGTLEWSKPTPFSLSFGHNILATSMQMLRSYAILANGGYDVQPTLVRKIIKTQSDGTQKVLLDNTSIERVKAFQRLLDPEIVERVVQSMKFVTKPGGGATRANIPGYTEAGKTATAEKIVNGVYSKQDHISSFVGFAPAKEAKFVLMIVIDSPACVFIPGVGKNQHGGVCAAPAFAQIGERTLQYLGIEPDDPYDYPAKDPRSNKEKTDYYKEVQRLKDLYQQWNG